MRSVAFVHSPQHGRPLSVSYCNAHTSDRTCASPSPVMSLSQLGDEQKERKESNFNPDTIYEENVSSVCNFDSL